MDNLKAIVGDNIRRLRRERGWTQAFVAESVGVSAPFLTMIEAGQRGMSIDFLENISRLFDIQPSLLFTEPDTTENSDRKIYLEKLKNRLVKKIDRVIDETIREFN